MTLIAHPTAPLVSFAIRGRLDDATLDHLRTEIGLCAPDGHHGLALDMRGVTSVDPDAAERLDALLADLRLDRWCLTIFKRSVRVIVHQCPECADSLRGSITAR